MTTSIQTDMHGFFDYMHYDPNQYYQWASAKLGGVAGMFESPLPLPYRALPCLAMIKK
jgi:hypothetical protein